MKFVYITISYMEESSFQAYLLGLIILPNGKAVMHLSASASASLSSPFICNAAAEH